MRTGRRSRSSATLKPVWQIDRQRTTRGGNSEKISSNLPPVVTLEAASTALAAPTSTTLSLSATDDGLPEAARRNGRHDGPVGEVSRAGRCAASRHPREARQRQGDDVGELHRAWRLHPAGGRRRRFRRVGRQFRLSLLLDKHAGENHGQRRRRAVCRPQSAIRHPQSEIQRANVRQRRRADLPGQVSDLPSPGNVGADVARHLRRSSSVGEIDSPARRQPRHAAMASRQDRRHQALQERPLAERQRDFDDRPLGRRRRAAGQPGRHAARRAPSGRMRSGSSASRT